MPLKNDYVNYSTHGICRVEEIRFMQFDRSSKGREYYILRPVHPDNIRIFVPMGNPHLEMCIRDRYMVGHKISDITEKVYTQREFDWLKKEIEKIK